MKEEFFLHRITCEKTYLRNTLLESLLVAQAREKTEKTDETTFGMHLNDELEQVGIMTRKAI